MKRLSSLLLVCLLFFSAACSDEPATENTPSEEEQKGYLFALPGDEAILEMRALGNGFVLLSRADGKWNVTYTDITNKILTETLLSVPADMEEPPVFETFSDDEEFGFVYLNHRLFFVSPQTGQYAEYTPPEGVDLTKALYQGGEFYYPAVDGVLSSSFQFESYSVLNSAPIENFGGLAALDGKTQTVYFATRNDEGFTGISSFVRGKEGFRVVCETAFDAFYPLKNGCVLLTKAASDGVTYTRLDCKNGEKQSLFLPIKRNYRVLSHSANGACLGGICYKDIDKNRTALDVYDLNHGSLLSRYDLVYAALYDQLAVSDSGQYVLYCRKTRDGRVVCYLDVTENGAAK